MGTNLYLRCEDHDPKLLSHESVANNTGQLSRVLDWLKERKFLGQCYAAGVQFDDGLGVAGAFFYQHPKCKLAVVDLFGQYYYLDEEDSDD